MKRRSLFVAEIIVIAFLHASFQCCLGQRDTNVIGVGDWSEPVTDEKAGTLRGRLLVYEGEEYCPMGESIYGDARIYLELQHVHISAWYSPMEIYFDIRDGLHFEMHDGAGKPIVPRGFSVGATVRAPCWLTLPCDSTVRVRADPGLGSKSKPDGLTILTDSGIGWVVPRSGKRVFFVWHG